MKNYILIALAALILSSCTSKNTQEQSTVENKQAPVNTFPKPKATIKTVGILLYDNYAVLDAMGPFHVFSELMGAKVFFVGLKKGTISTAGLKVQCDTSIHDVRQLDILVIPGGLNETYTLTRDTMLLNWIKSIDAHSKYTTSVCTGAWILAATGLLKNQKATTHWFGKQILKDQFGITAQNKRYVQSGKYFTSAGVSAGIDMSLAVVNDIMGEEYTKQVMLDLEYDTQPPVKGGSIENTDAHIVEDMRGMYNGALRSVLDPQSVKTIKTDNQIDPVCQMTIGQGVSDTLHFHGKVYGFCSGSCKARFKENPGAYLSTNSH